jgi:hypothetical protein
MFAARRSSGTGMRGIVLVSIVFAAGCASVTMAGGPVRSDGNVKVSETRSGTAGVALELGGIIPLRQGVSELEVVGTGDWAGYPAQADGDPIIWLGLSGRYRRYLARAGAFAPFVAAGGGVGGEDKSVVLEGILEVGVRVALGSHLAVVLSGRERPAGFFTGVTHFDGHNTLEAAIGIEIALPGTARRAPPARRTETAQR